MSLKKFGKSIPGYSRNLKPISPLITTFKSSVWRLTSVHSFRGPISAKGFQKGQSKFTGPHSCNSDQPEIRRIIFSAFVTGWELRFLRRRTFVSLNHGLLSSKFVVYRKRKIFSGNRPSMIWWIWLRNTKGEIRVPCTDILLQEIFWTLDAQSIDSHQAVIYKTVASDLVDLGKMWTMMFWFFSVHPNNFAFKISQSSNRTIPALQHLVRPLQGSIGYRFTPWYSGTGTGGSIHDYGIDNTLRRRINNFPNEQGIFPIIRHTFRKPERLVGRKIIEQLRSERAIRAGKCIRSFGLFME